MKSFFGTKHQMTQVWGKNGRRYNATVIHTGPLTVTQVKTNKSDKYRAVQVGFGIKSTAKISKPMAGHLKKATTDKTTVRYLREIKLSQDSSHKVGDSINPSQILSTGDIVNIQGVSKGRGFAGVMKRWGFAGGPRTHGQSDRQRAPGSIGQGTDPGRVHKGKKMPGRMGNKKFTVKNLKILHIDDQKNELIISGPIPGVRGSIITINKVRSSDPIKLHSKLTPPSNESSKPSPSKTRSEKKA